jgi:hypothetical protein
MRKSWVLAALAAMLASMAAPAAAQCIKESPPHAVALVELYTSEGCNSCPPADRWLSRIAREGPGPDSVVPLAFHVDYWDRLGWKDRFASARFSERQYALARQAGSRAVYTPGVFFNFQEFRGWGSARFDDALRAVNARPARADIRVELDSPSAAALSVKASFRSKERAQAFLALYENGLSTNVKAGENRGVTLRHDFVVREWIGPIEVNSQAELRQAFTLEPDWKVKDMGVAAFVEHRGEVLQATALPVCINGWSSWYINREMT